MKITDLPCEIINEIIQDLPLQDIYNLYLAHKCFHVLSKSNLSKRKEKADYDRKMGKLLKNGVINSFCQNCKWYRDQFANLLENQEKFKKVGAFTLKPFVKTDNIITFTLINTNDMLKNFSFSHMDKVKRVTHMLHLEKIETLEGPFSNIIPFFFQKSGLILNHCVSTHIYIELTEYDSNEEYELRYESFCQKSDHATRR